MAVFSSTSVSSWQPYLRETSDFMYIRGQAHTKTTLKPIYGNQIVSSAPVDTHLIVNNSANYAFGPDLVGSTANAAGIFASCQHRLCGFDLKRSYTIPGTKKQLISDAMSTASTYRYVHRLRPDGSVETNYHTHFVADQFFLFANSEYAFYVSTETGHTSMRYGSSTGSFAPFSGLNVNNSSLSRLGATVKPPAASANAVSNWGCGVPSLIGYDKTNLTATVAFVTLPSSSSVVTGYDFANSYVVTMNGNEGPGTFTNRKIVQPTGFFTNSNLTSGNRHLKQLPSFTKEFTGSDGLRKFFMFDRNAGANGSYDYLYLMKYDPSTEGTDVTGEVVTSFVRNNKLNSTVDPTEKGAVVRMIERDGYFYLVFVYNLVKNKSTAPGSTSSLRIDVFKGTYDNPLSITKVSEYEGSIAYTCFEVFDMNGEFTQLAVLNNGNANSEVLIFNEAREEYVQQTVLDYRIKIIMNDDLNRTWIQTHNNTVLLQGPTVGNSVKVGFEEFDAEYKGQQINTAALVSCYNFLGQRVANNVTLQLEGGVSYFGANGESTITVMTDVAGDLRVPVAITGNGYVRIVANMAL